MEYFDDEFDDEQQEDDGIENVDSFLSPKSNIVYNILDLESDRFLNLKRVEQDLYFKDPSNGEFIRVADAYDQSFHQMNKDLLKKKKLRFFITFVETFDMEDNLTPTALRLVRMFARQMSYGNIIKGMGFEDIKALTGTAPRYITLGIEKLMENDVIRFKVLKGRREYMINPVYYYKGSAMGIHTAIRAYKKFPRNMNEY